MHRIIGQTLQAQFPVLNWWAFLSVLTRAASTITVILIFVLARGSLRAARRRSARS